jgi:rhamnose utilization protein RhaD (predicted bifunctional aldolase and dehydrogenase)
MKGSGSDMKTITHKQFTPLRLDDLLPLMKREEMTDDEMVAYQSKSVLEPGSPKSSIETLLHAFLPPPHIYHTHADAICALTDTPNSATVIRRVFGTNVAVIPYSRPGFLLSKRTGEAYANRSGLRAIILDKHGLITWGDTARAAYLETIRMITEAERFIARHRKPSRVRIAPGKQAETDRRSIAAAVAPTIRAEFGARQTDGPAVRRQSRGSSVCESSEGRINEPSRAVHARSPDAYETLAPLSPSGRFRAYGFRKNQGRPSESVGTVPETLRRLFRPV